MTRHRQVVAAEQHQRSPWGVVMGAFLVTMVGFGAAYSFAAFAPELEREFAVPRTAVNLVYSVSGGLAFLVSAASGAIADRAGPRLDV